MNLSPPFLNKKLGIIVCADDFGASAEINDAIIGLLRSQRISAVSCLVTGEAWEQGAALLKSFRGAADIGLHLIYDEIPFDRILIFSHTKRLNKDLILKKFKFQLDRFVEKMGAPPDYIDGHKHVHQLPIFRSALMELIEDTGLNKIYVRNSALSFKNILERKISILKNICIALPGHSLRKDLHRKGIPTNNDFLGVYDFNSRRDPGEILERFLSAVRKTNSILLSHPSCENKLLNGKNNGFEKKQVQELKYLESNEYKDALERYGLYLTRFTHAPAA